MKKHPVDDLFKRKLTDLNKKPSDHAWLKIQQSTEKRRRPAVWIWYAAASVVIALVAGYAVWENTGGGQEINSGREKIIALKEKKPDNLKPESIVQADSQQVVAENKQGDQLSNIDQTTRIESHKKAVNVVAGQPEVEIPHKQEIAVIEDKKMEPVKNAESVLELQKMEISKPAYEALALSKVSKPHTEPAVTIIVAVETNEDEVDEMRKPSKFSRVFRQLKNARAGERVDWDEVGFNPKNLVARVDDRFRNKDEGRNAEKDQNPKQRTKL